MATLLQEREASSETPADESPTPAPEGACTQCGATLDRNQDWCLECGAAAPGRIGTHPPGWRAALTVILVTLLLVGGATVASYSALTGDAERDAAQPPAGSGNPIQAQAPADSDAAITPERPTGPGTDPSQVTPKQPAQKSTNTPPRLNLPSQPKTSTPAAPVTPTQPTTPENTKPAAPPVIDIKIPQGAAATYDPTKRPGAEFGSAAKATDGKEGTVWDVTTPADNAPLQVGLVIDLPKAYTLDSVKILTPTSGFNVELYGSRTKALPEDILDKRWEHLSDGKAVSNGQSISVKGKSKNQLRKLVLWFTAPADAADPRVAISEVSIRGSE